ncbi:MAG: hypothetical protein HC800_01330 [Phormidesmis sp. RL_2_1]|nr:hypothetical protein [Phormidesmis sp. RL_2_1]
MNNDLVRVVILLCILLVIAFPFAGLAPLTLLLLVALCGWAFQLVTTIIDAAQSSEGE